jgi:hypothetical protein
VTRLNFTQTFSHRHECLGRKPAGPVHNLGGDSYASRTANVTSNIKEKGIPADLVK